MRGWRVVGEEERRPGRPHRAADSRQRRAEERWQPAAAGRQMPAAGLTRWAQRPQLVQGVGRSARTSRISRQSGCPGRDRPRGAPRPGLTCSCRRGQQSCGAAVAGAQLLRRSRARGPGLMQHGRPALCISGRAGWGHRAPVGGAQRQPLRDEQTEPGAANGDAECSAQRPPLSALQAAVLHSTAPSTRQGDRCAGSSTITAAVGP